MLQQTNPDYKVVWVPIPTHHEVPIPHISVPISPHSSIPVSNSNPNPNPNSNLMTMLPIESLTPVSNSVSYLPQFPSPHPPPHLSPPPLPPSSQSSNHSFVYVIPTPPNFNNHFGNYKNSEIVKSNHHFTTSKRYIHHNYKNQSSSVDVNQLPPPPQHLSQSQPQPLSSLSPSSQFRIRDKSRDFKSDFTTVASTAPSLQPTITVGGDLPPPTVYYPEDNTHSNSHNDSHNDSHYDITQDTPNDMKSDMKCDTKSDTFISHPSPSDLSIALGLDILKFLSQYCNEKKRIDSKLCLIVHHFLKLDIQPKTIDGFSFSGVEPKLLICIDYVWDESEEIFRDKICKSLNLSRIVIRESNYNSDSFVLAILIANSINSILNPLGLDISKIESHHKSGNWGNILTNIISRRR